MTAIRVIKTTTNDFGPHNGTGQQKVDHEVYWQGETADELSRTCPPSDIMFADELGHKEIEDGLILFDYTFERQSADGSWEKISDPRRRITPVTESEREQDAENRRLFPGDYFTGCEACGYEHCQGECEEDAYDYSDEEYERAS